jgi:hypothetical protein
MVATKGTGQGWWLLRERHAFDLLVRKEKLCALAILRHSLYALCAVDTRQLDLLLNLATTRSSL